jgi:RNA polymerase sigma-70 factor, ECF subfamily
MTHDSEREWDSLMHRIAGGDSAALSSLYDSTSPSVYGLVRRMLGDDGAAEEATLDTYLQVWRRAKQFDPARGAASSWILAIARHLAIDRLRSGGARRREEPLDAAFELAASGDGPPDATARGEQRRRVLAALERLSPEQREAIAVAFFSGLSHSEVAERLRVPLGTVKTRIRTGMMKLREHLEPLHTGSRP